jgi:NADH:ubiquinone oxidoreductase subunit 6 (subunit J)
MLLYTVLLMIAVVCAIQAIGASRLVAAALWLAGVSVFIAIVFYAMGAREVAVIELSVGAGLVTVLMVFAIAISGEDAMKTSTVVPRLLALGLVVLAILLLGWLTLPTTDINPTSSEAPFPIMFWQHRGLDTVLQIGLIFAGVLGVLGLLSEAKASGQAVEPDAIEHALAENESRPVDLPQLETAYEDELEEQRL